MFPICIFMFIHKSLHFESTVVEIFFFFFYIVFGIELYELLFSYFLLPFNGLKSFFFFYSNATLNANGLLPIIVLMVLFGKVSYLNIPYLKKKRDSLKKLGKM